MDLGQKRTCAIVTGGSRGIAKVIARELARERVDVAIAARSKAPLAATAKALEALTGRRIVPMAAGVTSKAQVESLIAEAIARLGRLHILVNCGADPGARATGPIETVNDEELLHDVDVRRLRGGVRGV